MAALVLALCCLIALLAYLAWNESTVWGLLAQQRKRRAIVTLKSGEAFEGVVYAVDRDSIILREASALAYGQGATNVTVEGEVLILRADVAYLQLP